MAVMSDGTDGGDKEGLKRPLFFLCKLAKTFSPKRTQRARGKG